MKKFVFSLVAVIIICACSTPTKKYSIKNNHYKDLKYGFSLDLPNRKFWKIHTKWPEKWVNSSTVSPKSYLNSGRLVMINKSSFGIIIISAKSMGQLMIRAVEECDKFKLLLLEIRKEYSSEFEEKAWVSEDSHLLKGNDCLVNFELIDYDIRVLGISYFKVYRKIDNVIINIILVSNSRKFGSNYLTFTDLVQSLTFHTADRIVKEIGRDNTFIAYDNGVVKDTKTGLEWVVGPDDDSNWYEAKSWVENLTVDGGDWRMPTRNELETLYQKGVGTRNMTILLKTTGWSVWAGEMEGSSVWTAYDFEFYHGRKGWSNREFRSGARAFAVRSHVIRPHSF